MLSRHQIKGDYLCSKLKECFLVPRIIVQKSYYQLPHFVHGCYIYYAWRFTSYILNVAKDHFDISLLFYLLDYEVMELFMYEFEWLKNENFVFTWGCQQFVDTSSFTPPTSALAVKDNILKEMFNDVFN